MKKTRTVLVKHDGIVFVKGSTRGCGIRYTLCGYTPFGEYMRIDTNPASLSNDTCDIHCNFLRVTVREKGLASCIADEWESSASSGDDLELEFEHQKSLVNNQEQDHGQ